MEYVPQNILAATDAFDFDLDLNELMVGPDHDLVHVVFLSLDSGL